MPTLFNHIFVCIVTICLSQEIVVVNLILSVSDAVLAAAQKSVASSGLESDTVPLVEW